MNNNGCMITVENISKKFCKSLKRSLWYGVHDLTMELGGRSKSHRALRKDEFFAVRDVSFEVRKGETLGIIGPNGTGKTTLLKMLNGIYVPDEGRITVKGKVGSLIAVGAGFHPMLTGRENIYINGAMFQLTKEQIDKRYNSIVEFADIGDFLDMPVKNYSSGMFVRLGVAVAVYCEADILLIDEVLSVGDLAFQNKSLRRLDELRRKANAVIFVSHNLEHVRNLCDTVLVMDGGRIVFRGDTHEGLLKYYEITRNKKQFAPELSQSSGDIVFVDSGILDATGKAVEKIKMGEGIRAFFEFEIPKNYEELYFTVGIQNELKQNCITHMSNDSDSTFTFQNIAKGRYKLIVTFARPHLVPGTYFPVMAIRNGITNETYERVRNLKPFIIEGDIIPRGIVHTDTVWKLERIDAVSMKR